MIGKTLHTFWAAVLCAGIILVGLLFQSPRTQPQAAYAQAASTPTPSAMQRTVSVTGSGVVNAQPDIAILVLGVQTDAPTASQAMSDNSKQMQAVVDALTKAGIASADIQTQTLQLTPNYAQPTVVPQAQSQVQPQATPQATTQATTVSPTAQPTPQNRVTSYTAANTVQVTVRKLDTLGSVIDAAVAAGSNTIQSLSFSFADQSKIMDQAREAAMKDAQHKAQQLATLANVKVGTVVSINESSSTPIEYGAPLAVARAAGVPVQPGTQAVTVTVQVTWELQP